MDRIEIGKLSAAYDVRRLGLADAPVVYAFCKADTQYYARCGAEVTLALVEHDLTALPPGVSPEQHYYLGFFTRGTLTAVMDLIAGYPGGSDLSLGFFMTHSAIQGAGTGSRIASEALAALQAQGITQIHDIHHIQRGYEDLTGDLRSLGAEIAAVEGSEI